MKLMHTFIFTTTYIFYTTAHIFLTARYAEWEIKKPWMVE